MTLQQLEYVIALDTYRHYVTAAERCFVTQPTITTQVKKLEAEIGANIFDRSTTPLKPTAIGEVIIQKARSIVQEVQQLKEMVNTERESIQGTFRIGVIPTISQYLVPKFAGRFAKHYPETVLHIEELKTENIIEALAKNKIDVGILVTPLEESFIREIKLYNEPFVFYGDASHPLRAKKTLDPQDVESLNDLWLLNSGHCFRNQVLNICNSAPEERSIQFQSGSIESLKSMVNNYGGFTLVPETTLSASDQANCLYFNDPKPIREVSLVVHNTFAKEGLIDALRTEILHVTPDAFEKNERFIKVKWR